MNITASAGESNMPHVSALAKKISGHQAVIAVIGLGYVGLPLALSFARKGFKTFGVDTNEHRVDALKTGKSYITDIHASQVHAVLQGHRFIPTTDMTVLRSADAILICVPTPIKRKYTPDVSFILSAVRSTAKYMKKGALVILESTTYPGTTDELIRPELEKSGLKAGRDFFLAFSPERIDPGNKHFEVSSIPKVVGGMTANCTILTAQLYRAVIKQVHVVSSPKAAEMTKLLENSFRIVNIGWINEIAQTCHKLGIDVWEVIDAAKTKPFGFMPFYPGLGVGGHCIPEDPLYLYWKAKRYGFNSKFIKLAAETNAHMPLYVAHRLEEAVKKPLEKVKVLVLGVTYKKDVKDLRKSPAIKLIDVLRRRAKVDFYDPMIPFLKVDGLDMEGIALTSAALKRYDVVVVAVDHSKVDYAFVLEHAKKIFDVKNIYNHTQDRKIVRL